MSRVIVDWPKYLVYNPLMPTTSKPMSGEERRRERSRGEKWAKALSSRDVHDFVDQQVLGDFDWRDWFEKKQSSAFINGAFDAAQYREEMGEPNPSRGEDQYGVEKVPDEVFDRALEFTIASYGKWRDKYPAQKAYNKAWDDLHRASYGTDSKIGYFIRYAHQIGEVTLEAQKIVEAERKKRVSRRRSR